MKSIFPYQGGKSRVSVSVWEQLGDAKNYVEPFCGSAAVLFNRPEDHKNSTETINDIDGLITNAYRSIKYKPEETAEYADYPVSELDIEARHHYCCKAYAQTDFINKMRTDIEYCDPQLAGYWIYGQCSWIGSGWCSDKQINKYKDGDPDIVERINNNLAIDNREDFGRLPHLGNKGTGINRVNREDFGRLPHLGTKGTGINRISGGNRQIDYIYNLFAQYCKRLRKVRICCGDWQRVLTPSCTYKHGLTAVFLDPPYSQQNNKWDEQNGYRNKSESVWDEVVDWCLDNQDPKNYIIALCGHQGDFIPPKNWRTIKWKRGIGYSKNNTSTRSLERIWIFNSQKKEYNNYHLFNEEEV